MKIEQYGCNEHKEWTLNTSTLGDHQPQLVLIFGSPAALQTKENIDWLRTKYPQANLLGCSSAGEICGDKVLDDTLVSTAIYFENSSISLVEAQVNGPEESYQVGKSLASKLATADLKHTLVLSDGIKVNGSELVKGLRDGLPVNVDVTGGLAGDGARFQETWIITNGGPQSGRIALLGFYGDNIKIAYGSLGGWDSFGPERRITRSSHNVLYELDGQSALALYKTYLAEHAANLPASGLLFPLEIKTEGATTGIVRTILAVNEEDQSMTFAGDMPEGSTARLMKANFNRLIDGAVSAAETCCANPDSPPPDLAILISCVGRKLILKQRIEEEVEAAREVLGAQAVLTGFYSYGEISPFSQGGRCELHNQTMTITTFSERTP